MAAITITAVGDSNSVDTAEFGGGWPEAVVAALADLYPGNTYTLFNRAVGGTDSEDATDDFANVLATNPDIVFYCHGTNDAYFWRSGTGEGGVDYSPTGFAVRLEAFINGMTPGVQIILVTSPACAEQSYGTSLWRDAADMELYRDVTRAAGVSHNLTVIDWFALMLENSNWFADYMMPDGAHVNLAGKTPLINAILDILTSPFRHLDGTIAGVLKKLDGSLAGTLKLI